MAKKCLWESEAAPQETETWGGKAVGREGPPPMHGSAVGLSSGKV